ncbi:MAG: hypothetical protein GY810_14340 [Aureispira sp.]|nr:hypothetical protein [Aureispira sp.]
MYKSILLSICLLASYPLTSLAQTSLEHFVNVYEQFDSIAPQEKVYAHTDRSLYTPSENIWFKVYLTDAENCPSSESNNINAELIGPRGNTISSLLLQNIKGTAKGNFQLAASASGGIYKLRIYSTWMKNFDQSNYFEKDITVQKVVLPNLLMKLDYEREAYGAGSEVIATLNLRDKSNKVLENTTFSYTAKVANKEICTETAQTDQNGEATILFELPQVLNSTDGLLNIQVEHEGQVESISRSIPITLNNIDIQFLPEGGHIIANTTNTIAFKALNEFGKPADITAVLLDKTGKELSRFESYHQGMGAFDLDVIEEQEYQIKIVSPKGIDKLYQLPQASPKTVGLHLKEHNKKELQFNIYSSKPQELYVIAQLHGQVLFSKAITATVGQNKLNLPSKDWPIGIAQITIFDQSQQPQAERLVFVNKHRQLDIKIKTNKEKYNPREEVKLNLTVRDELGKPVQGDFSLAVINDNNWTFADDKQDDILSYLLMSSDLKGEVYEPNFYFDPNKPKADTALDYVMLTHGWRRYDWESINSIAQWVPTYADEKHIIDGIAVWNDAELVKNTKVYLSKSRHNYSKKNALAETKTNDKGLFSFQDINCDFPVYANIRSRGYRISQKICNYTANTYLKDIETGKYITQIPCYDYEDDGVTKKRRYRRANTNSYGYGYGYNSSSGYSSESWLTVPSYNSDYNNDKGSFYGRILDSETNEPLPFATVILEQNGVLVTGASSDFDGNFLISNLDPGTYDVRFRYIGYDDLHTTVNILANQKVNIDAHMGSGVELSEVTISATNYSNKMSVNAVSSSAFGRSSESTTISADDIQRMATRNISSIAATTAGINQADEGEALNSNGSRSSGNDTYVDGVRVLGNAGIASSEIDETTVSVPGVSAQFENNNRIARTRNISSLDVIAYKPTVLNQDISFSGQTLTGRDISRMSTGSTGDAGNRYNSNTYWSNNNTRQLQVQQLGNYALQFYTTKEFYSPKYKQNKQVTVRNDFRQTVYWTPSIHTDKKGKASVSFCNSDATTTFRAVVEGSNSKGLIGRSEKTYAVQMPFSLDLKTPAVLSYGDTVNFPILLKNTTNKPLISQLTVRLPQALKLLKPIDSLFTLEPNSSKIVYLPTQVLHKRGKYQLYVDCKTNELRDQVLKTIEIAPKGFPATASVAGQQMQLDTFINIYDPVDGSIQGNFNAYPSILDGLLDGVKGILRQPSGCFEQVSSSNYPNMLALQLMENTGKIDPNTRKVALSYLNTGYSKIAGYETAQGGFEWYGRTPPHEGLTAYGLIQLHDMQKVYEDVDPKLIQRVQKFLIRRKNGNGGFKQNVGKYGFSSNKPAVFNAYITWALASVGEKDIVAELNAITKEATQSEDWYRMALATLAQLEYGNQEQGEELLNNLLHIIKKQGLTNIKTETTLTYSSGNASTIETLSFVILAMLKSKNTDSLLLNQLVEHILSYRSYGRFGSTQSTIMAMKALVAYTEYSQDKATDGEIQLYINEELAHSQKYSQEALRKINVEHLEKFLHKGKNTIVVKFLGTQKALPYSLDIQWTAHTPSSSEYCKVDLTTQLDTKNTTVGETVRLSAQLSNTTNKALPSTMAIVGIPPGLSLQPWQLKELLDKKVVDFYEIKQNYLCLYYSELEKNATRDINLDLKVEVPGVYQAPASTAYLYYTDEYKKWIAGEKITIN